MISTLHSPACATFVRTMSPPTLYRLHFAPFSTGLLYFLGTLLSPLVSCNSLCGSW